MSYGLQLLGKIVHVTLVLKLDKQNILLNFSVEGFRLDTV